MSLFIAIVAAAPFAAIAFHLGRIAYESRELPDRLLAGLFFAFTCGTPLRIIATDMVTSGAGDSAALGWITAAGNLVIGIGIVCLVGFVERVFRPYHAWGRILMAVISVAIAGVTLRALGGDVAAHGSSVWAIAFDAIAGIAFAWAFIECILYYLKLRRRLSVGIADPVVVNRFLLWSIWTGAISVLAIEIVALRASLALSGAGAILAAGGDPGAPWLTLIAAAKISVVVAAPIAAISVWLSFSPPSWYERMLR